MARDKLARILVVDDDDSVRNSLAGFLEDYDYKVKSSSSAEDALALIRHEPFDVAIIDLRLPEMDGEELIKTIYDERYQIRFLIHTGSYAFRLTPILMAIGMRADHVFHKPQVNLEPMRNTIEMIIKENIVWK